MGCRPHSVVRLAPVVRRAVGPVEGARTRVLRVLGGLGRRRERVWPGVARSAGAGNDVLLAVAGLRLRGVRHARLGGSVVRGTRERAALGGTHLEVSELAFEVDLEPAAVLAFEGAQVVDLALELFALLHERAHDLAVPLLRVAVQPFGPRARLAHDLVGLAAGLA